MIEQTKSFCANCKHCIVIRLYKSIDLTSYKLRTRCLKGNWETRGGEEKIHKYFTIDRRTDSPACKDYNPVGELYPYLTWIKKCLPIKDEMYHSEGEYKEVEHIVRYYLESNSSLKEYESREYYYDNTSLSDKEIEGILQAKTRPEFYESNLEKRILTRIEELEQKNNRTTYDSINYRVNELIIEELNNVLKVPAYFIPNKVKEK